MAHRYHHRRWLFVAALGASFAPSLASAASGAGTATVVTVRPLSLVKTDDLDFGGLIASSAAGSATINASTDARTTIGGVVAAGGTPTAAHFTAAGAGSILALITLPTSITITRGGGTETMAVGTITSNGPNLRLFPGTGTFDVAVGGTLSVAANQVAGTYTGTFTVTVLYF